MGCAAPYVEAVSRELIARTLPENLAQSDRTLTIVHCKTDDEWSYLESLATEPGTVVVALIPEMLAANYRRAIQLGVAGVVHSDLGSSTVADVIDAALHGEALLPIEAVRSMAIGGRAANANVQLDGEEHTLLRQLAEGVTVVEIAKRHHFNERTIRRHLQNLYLKLGAPNRDAAIASATRMGLLDPS